MVDECVVRQKKRKKKLYWFGKSLLLLLLLLFVRSFVPGAARQSWPPQKQLEWCV